MNEMQKKLIEMLGWFHEFCLKNNFRYYIIAGTMLGAVRHGGFIPWDDDIDVGMPRSDYERMKRLYSGKGGNKYVFEFPDFKNKEYPFLWGKLYDTTTTFIEKQRHPVKRGIYIDVFPLDGVGNDLSIAEKNYKHFYSQYRLNLMISSAFLKRRSLKKNAGVLVGRIISPLFVNKQKLAKRIDVSCKRFDFDKSDFVCNLLGGAGTKGIVPRSCFGTPTLIKFNKLEVFGLEKPDIYLKSMYGDYRKLPPVEKQISLHDSICLNLNKGYLE